MVDFAEQSLVAGDISGYRDAASFELVAQEHEFAVYPSGAERKAALLELIAGAKVSLCLCFYMFQPDRAGEEIRDALISAAKRGVDVHLIVDAFGSDAPNSFFKPLLDSNGRYAVFSPRLSIRYLIRNHQKFVIADGQRVMTGGFNISDSYFQPPSDNGWCDLGVAINGPVVAKFCLWFEQLEQWVAGKGSQFRVIRKMVREWQPGSGPVQLLLGGPTRISSTWARQVRRDIADGNRLDMAMAYFSPSRSVRQLIHGLGKRGHARLIMAGKTDNGATIGASRSLYRKMLAANVRVAEFQPCKLHIKLIVIDDTTYFGSANFDMRSVRLNLELMVRVRDADLADRMRGLIDTLDESSVQISPDWCRKKATWFNRLRWRLARLIVSGVDYTVTRRLNLGM